MAIQRKMNRADVRHERNIAAKTLMTRAGNAGAPVAVDTRHKVVQPRKGRGSYRRCQEAYSAAAW